MITVIRFSLVNLLLLCCFADMYAQPVIISGMSGTLQDTAAKTTVDYTVTLEGAATIANWNAIDYCGVYWTGIDCPTMGNQHEDGIVTYTFSSPVRSFDLMLCHVNMNGSVAPETFTLTVNAGHLKMEVDKSECADWSVTNNVLTSPSTEGGIHAIVHISCDTAFTTFTIMSGHNESTGGAGTAFVQNSVQVREPASTPFVIPPVTETEKKHPKNKRQ